MIYVYNKMTISSPLSQINQNYVNFLLERRDIKKMINNLYRNFFEIISTQIKAFKLFNSFK